MSKISVVIATLGGEQLIQTVEALNAGTVVPDEILICVPESQNVKLDLLNAANLRVIRTKARGQVAQRAIGFQEVHYDYVLQLDDDIIVDKHMIQHMLFHISKSPFYAVGPKFFDYTTRRYQSYMIPQNMKSSFYERIQYFIINGNKGFEQGRISKAGICMGICDNDSDIVSVDWLPGGCMMHHKKNLLLYNFYPFIGKAYAEDIFHSVFLRRRNVKLVRTANAKCYINNAFLNEFSAKQFFKEIKQNTRALKTIVKEINGSYLRLYLFLVMNSHRLIFKRFFR